MELNTNRLSIRTLRASDWRGMGRIFADFERSPYAIYDAPLPVGEEAVQALTRQFAETGLFFAVFLPDTMEQIGYVCFHGSGDCCDVGYCFHSSAHRQGYAHEAVRALLDYMTNTHGASAFTAGTALNNTPSCALLNKLGFTCVSTETLSFRKDAAGNDISFLGGNFVMQYPK